MGGLAGHCSLVRISASWHTKAAAQNAESGAHQAYQLVSSKVTNEPKTGSIFYLYIYFSGLSTSHISIQTSKYGCFAQPKCFVIRSADCITAARGNELDFGDAFEFEKCLAEHF